MHLWRVMADYSYLPELVTEVIDWSQNGLQTPFLSATILRNGPASLAFVPHANPECVVKAIKPNRMPRGLQVKEEYELMAALQQARSERFVTPEPLAFGIGPNFIAMRKLGGHFECKSMNDEMIERVGRAVGAFCAYTWEKFGSVHNDICIGNYTKEPDGTIGIIDIASVEKVKAPDELFCVPLLQKPNINPYLAAEFEQSCGREISYAAIHAMMGVRLAKFLACHPQDVAQRIQSDVASNFEEWRMMIEAGRLNSDRPQLRKARGATPAPKAGS